MRIEIVSPGTELYAELNRRLVAFNQAERPLVNWRTDNAFTVAVHDASGVLRGGARGFVRIGAVEIRGVWLDEEVRGQHLGEKIMQAAESEARRRGAKVALLDTYDFQARGFYERLGYTCFATFDFPQGVQRFYMSRKL
jgi:GNAT superfamily N-acetyltransferase